MSAVARFLLPLATALAATPYLAAAVPHQLDHVFSASPVESPAQAELTRCVGTGRAADACMDEADGKALVERAEWLARADDAARRGARP